MKSKSILSVAAVLAAVAIAWLYFPGTTPDNNADLGDELLTTDTGLVVGEQADSLRTANSVMRTQSVDTGVTPSTREATLQQNTAISPNHRTSSPDQLSTELSSARQHATDSRSRNVLSDNPFSISELNSRPPDQSKTTSEESALGGVSIDDQNDLQGLLLQAALDDDDADSPGLIEIEFTFSPMSGLREVPEPTSLTVQEKIYAHVLAQNSCSRCIYKWQHYESGEVLFLSVMTLEANQPQTLFTTPELGWNTGRYVMSVYDAGNANELLGRGSLNILTVLNHQQTEEPEVEYIQSLLSTGRAESKLTQSDIVTVESRQPTIDQAYIQSLLSSGQAVQKTK